MPLPTSVMGFLLIRNNPPCSLSLFFHSFAGNRTRQQDPSIICSKKDASKPTGHIDRSQPRINQSRRIDRSHAVSLHFIHYCKYWQADVVLVVVVVVVVVVDDDDDEWKAGIWKITNTMVACVT